MLEDVLQPQRLYWLVHVEVPSAADVDLKNIMNHIRISMSEHKARLAPYQREVMQVYAALWLRVEGSAQQTLGASDPCARYVWRGVEETGLTSPSLSHEAVHKLCTELVHAPNPRYDAVRLMLNDFVVKQYSCMGRVVGALFSFPAGAKDALRTILTRYAPECTFKTRGDFNVHSELLINKLPSWISCALVHNEMPYPLCTKVYPTNVNKVVRPLLDRAITDSLELVNFESSAFDVSDFITIMCLVIEILASSDIHFLINVAVVRNTKMVWPLPYVWRGPSGVLEHGIRFKNTLHIHAASVTAPELCLQWLRMCMDEGVGATKNLADLLFTPSGVAERNPLKKFLF